MLTKEQELKDKEQQIKDAEKTLKSLQKMNNNTDLPEHRWKDCLRDRINCVKEILDFYKTGEKSSIRIREYTEEEIENRIQHLK